MGVEGFLWAGLCSAMNFSPDDDNDDAEVPQITHNMASRCDKALNQNDDKTSVWRDVSS